MIVPQYLLWPINPSCALHKTFIMFSFFVCSLFLLTIPGSLFPSYSETNNNNTLSLNQDTGSSTNDSPSSKDNTSGVHYVFKFKWGSFGQGNDQFRRPHDIAFDSQGNVFVTDRDNNNVQKFTHNGTLSRHGDQLDLLMGNSRSHTASESTPKIIFT